MLILLLSYLSWHQGRK